MCIRDRFRSDWPKITVVVGYGVTLGFWIIAPKPVQFYYHYLMPSVFLLAGLALSLSDLRTMGQRYLTYGVLAGSSIMFAFFFPILSAASLDDRHSFRTWTWIEGWR